MNIEEFESILETYTMDEILEMNDLSLADALEFLYENKFVTELPDYEPVTVEPSWLNTQIPGQLEELFD